MCILKVFIVNTYNTFTYIIIKSELNSFSPLKMDYHFAV